MFSFFFSIFTRYFLAFSGFLVFVITSLIYDAEGRGIIAIGISFVTLIALLSSLNIGREFLFKTGQDKKNIKLYLIKYLKLQYILIIIGFILFVLFSFSLNSRLHDFELTLIFAVGIPNYIWMINGSIFYATCDMTFKQEIIINLTRLSLLFFLLTFFYIFPNLSLKIFILFYLTILSIGSIFEIIYLKRQFVISEVLPLTFSDIFNKRLWLSHVDYISFHYYPSLLIFIYSFVFTIEKIGVLNFAIQLVSFIYIISTVASYRLQTYVSTMKVYVNSQKILQILLFTATLSFIFFLLIFFSLRTDLFNKYFSSFNQVNNFFYIIALSIPGYLVYQVSYPLLIKKDLLKITSIINVFFSFSLALFPIFFLENLTYYNFAFIYSFFYIFLLIALVIVNIKFKLF